MRAAFSALGSPFPAPTGIVDYQLRKPDGKRIVSVVGDYAASFVEVDALVPLTERLGIAAGVSAAHERYHDGADATFLWAAVAPRWRLGDRIDAAGSAIEQVIADPTQYREALSGKPRLSRSLSDGDRLHISHTSPRGRWRRTLYGGTAPAIVDAPRPVGGRSPLPKPAGFAYRHRNADRLDQPAAGLAYECRWQGVGEPILDAHRTWSEKTVRTAAAERGGIPQE